MYTQAKDTEARSLPDKYEVRAACTIMPNDGYKVGHWYNEDNTAAPIAKYQGSTREIILVYWTQGQRTGQFDLVLGYGSGSDAYAQAKANSATTEGQVANRKVQQWSDANHLTFDITGYDASSAAPFDFKELIMFDRRVDRVVVMKTSYVHDLNRFMYTENAAAECGGMI